MPLSWWQVPIFKAGPFPIISQILAEKMHVHPRSLSNAIPRPFVKIYSAEATGHYENEEQKSCQNVYPPLFVNIRNRYSVKELFWSRHYEDICLIVWSLIPNRIFLIWWLVDDIEIVENLLVYTDITDFLGRLILQISLQYMQEGEV